MPAYRLQTLMEIRQRAKEAAEQVFSEAVREVARQEKEQQRLEQDLADRKATRRQRLDLYMQEIMARGAGVSGMNAMNRYEQRLKDEEAQVALEIERQKEVVKRAKKVMEENKKAGLIVSWAIYGNRARNPQDPDLYLTVTYPNWAALDRVEEAMAISARVSGSLSQQDKAFADRSTMRESIGGNVLQEYILK